MIAVIDYDTGNLRSVANALGRLGAEFTVTDDPETIRGAERVLLPGVGEASTAMEKLRQRGLVEVIRSLPETQKIVFAPDRNLGSYIQRITGRKNMVIWDGACEVHEKFSAEKILEMKRRYPQAKVLAHPECKEEVLAVADVVGSTAALLKFASSDPCDTFLVVTEAGILFQMQQDNPNKRFIPVPPVGSESGCNECEYMKMVTLEKIYRTLQEESPEVILDEEIRRKAERSIQRMLEIKRS